MGNVGRVMRDGGVKTAHGSLSSAIFWQTGVKPSLITSCDASTECGNHYEHDSMNVCDVQVKRVLGLVEETPNALIPCIAQSHHLHRIQFAD